VLPEAGLQVRARDEAIVVLVEDLEEMRAALPRVGDEGAGRFVAEERGTATEAPIEIVLVDDAVAVAVEVIEVGGTPAPAPQRDAAR
jgi:hypothetical protein